MQVFLKKVVFMYAKPMEREAFPADFCNALGPVLDMACNPRDFGQAAQPFGNRF